MLFAINHGSLAVSTYATRTAASGRLEASIEKLSSGLRINKAADDAAGSAISEKLRRQVRGLSRAVQNAQDGISTIQAADGATGEIQDILQRMRELAGQACNETLTSNDRLELQNEIVQLRDDINRISYNTEFNTKKLLDGSQAAQIRSDSEHVLGIALGGAAASGRYDVSIAMIEAGVSQLQRSQMFTVAETGGMAVGSTQLQSISQFYDSSGTFALTMPQTLQVHGNARKASIAVDGTMSLDMLAAELQSAIANTTGLGIANSNVGLVNTAQTRIPGKGGYLQTTSGMIGENGDVAFAGNEALVDALGFSITRESKNSRVEVSSTDAMGNVTTRQTSDDTSTGLLQGIDVQFSSQPAQVAGFGGLETGLVLTGVFDSDFYIQVGNMATPRLIHAHQGNWSMEGLSRYLNTQFQTVSGVRSAVVDGEIRITYDPPDSGTPSLIEISPRFPKQNAIGIPTGVFSGFAHCQKKTANAVHGFSRFATAAGTVRFSVSDGVNAATISYALVTNQASPDLQAFSTWQHAQNTRLENANVQARIDAVNGSLTFTSLRVGTEVTDGGGSVQSRVNVTLNTVAMTHGIDRKFGLAQQSTAVGHGERNFTLAVADRSSQFQIGADEKESLVFSISNLSATALDVDNLDLTSVRAAEKSLEKIDRAMDKLVAERSRLGSLQNKLESAVKSLSSCRNDLTAVESRLEDVDAALEMVDFTRNRVVSESGNAMMAQANVMSQSIRALLVQ